MSGDYLIESRSLIPLLAMTLFYIIILIREIKSNHKESNMKEETRRTILLICRIITTVSLVVIAYALLR